jgi:hypothetical protein
MSCKPIGALPDALVSDPDSEGVVHWLVPDHVAATAGQVYAHLAGHLRRAELELQPIRNRRVRRHSFAATLMRSFGTLATPERSLQ